MSVIITLWVTLLIYGALTAAVPDVNEPHYLGKSKHFWDPAWCAGDLLLESSNAHAVFFFVMGYWTKWLSFPQLAWFGRAVGYGVLACGWFRTHHVLGVTRWWSWWSLCCYLAIASWGNFSGEWLVGGIEGKVFSYGFLLLAFADWWEQRHFRAAIFGGLAISFHPIAGGWAILAAMLTQCVFWLRHRQFPKLSDGIAWGGLLAFAIPGLLPAVQLLLANDPPNVRMNGTYLQVYYRLAHHLDPMTFPAQSYWGYAGLIVLSIGLTFALPTSSARRTWSQILFWGGVFAMCGLIAGWGPRPPKLMPYYLVRMNLLKFYPFRLFDIMLPISVALQLSLGMMSMKWPLNFSRRALLGGVMVLVILGVMAGGEWRRRQLVKPTVFDAPEWIEVCHWLRDHSPTGALVQTPIHNKNFKWYAGRAEYVTYKDVPQDNRGLVEWNRRMLFLEKWYREHRADGLYSNEDLRSLRVETGITHILTDRLGPFELAPSFTNGQFRVYDLNELAPPQ